MAWDPKFWEQDVTIANGLELAVQVVSDRTIDVEEAFLEMFGRILEGEDREDVKRILSRLCWVCSACEEEFVFQEHRTCPNCELSRGSYRWN